MRKGTVICFTFECTADIYNGLDVIQPPISSNQCGKYLYKILSVSLAPDEEIKISGEGMCLIENVFSSEVAQDIFFSSYQPPYTGTWDEDYKITYTI